MLLRLITAIIIVRTFALKIDRMELEMDLDLELK